MAYLIAPASLIIAILSYGVIRLVFDTHVKNGKAAIAFLIVMQLLFFFLYLLFVTAEPFMGVHAGLCYVMQASCTFTIDSLRDVSKKATTEKTHAFLSK